jgi:hypothetical protein
MVFFSSLKKGYDYAFIATQIYIYNKIKNWMKFHEKTFKLIFFLDLIYVYQYHTP